MKRIGRNKIVKHRNWTKTYHRHFDPFSCHTVAAQFRLKNLQALIELIDFISAHGAGIIQQEHTRAARFRVFGKFYIAKWDLFKA